MTNKLKTAQNPLVLRYHRLMDAFSKSDDERDFYLDKCEGFLLYIDLSSTQEELDSLEKELETHPDRYFLIPKLTFYETKKIMEGFVNEKVYDIDTKEKLTDIIQSKEARENFLEFIHDHHHELEKWHQFYQERSRIRIIEWLRNHDFDFVFEEDLEVPLPVMEKVKKQLFQTKVAKDVAQARQTLKSKAKTYYSNEALNPRPKRGRPPKQVAKVEVEPQFTDDFYQTVPSCVRPFLYVPDITNASSVTFSARYGSEEELIANLRNNSRSQSDRELEVLSEKLASLQELSQRLAANGYEVEDTASISQTDQELLMRASEAPPEEEEKESSPKEKKASATARKSTTTKKATSTATTKKKAAPAKAKTARKKKD